MSNFKLNYFSIDNIAEWQKQTATRFGELVVMVGGRMNACKIIGDVNPDTISNWSTGKSKLPFYAACRLCQATGNSLEWLATGHEIYYSSVSMPDLYQQIHDQLVSYIETRDVRDVSITTVAKLCSYLTKRFEQKAAQHAEEEGRTGFLINIGDFQDEIDLVLGQ